MRVITRDAHVDSTCLIQDGQNPLRPRARTGVHSLSMHCECWPIPPCVAVRIFNVSTPKIFSDCDLEVFAGVHCGKGRGVLDLVNTESCGNLITDTCCSQCHLGAEAICSKENVVIPSYQSHREHKTSLEPETLYLRSVHKYPGQASKWH